MGLNANIDLTPEQRRIILGLLRTHLPNVTVWAYGSRVRWNARPYSDLDLVAFTAPGQESQLANLKDAFEESNLPFGVDLLAWDDLPESFHRRIKKDYAVLQEQVTKEGRVGWHNLPFSEAVLLNPTVGLERGVSYPFVSMADLIADSRSACTSERREYRGGGSRFQKGDTLMARITPCLENGKIARYYAKDKAEFAHGSTEFIVIRGRPEVTDNNFAYYLTRCDEVCNYAISQMMGTSGRQRVPTDSLGHLRVSIPPLPEQRRIAHVLGTLDDKIEANRRMNQTLEAMAQALFKSWFIDFDPVHAKATLNNHHSPLEGESARQGRSPQSRRWGAIRRGYTQRTLTTAQTLRCNRTDAEGLLWHYLRNNQLDGHRFRRQHPIGPYIVDFACLARKILIELDGSQHAERQDNDKKRDAFLRARGYRVLRFWNNEVFENCFGVLERIYEAVMENPPPEPHAPDGLTAPTPPQGGSDWTVERARAYLDSMDPEIAALFPNRFVDSELGKIPEGWEVKPLDHCASLNPESWSRANTPEWVEYVDLASTKLGVIEATQHVLWKDAPSRAKRILRPGDTIVGTVRPGNGSYSLIGKHGLTGSTGFAVLRPVHSRYREFVYLAATTTENIERLAHRADGAAYPAVRPDVVGETPVVMPSVNNDLLNCFSKTVASILNRVESNKAESRALTALRDVLLQKLISGEIRVSQRNICV